MIDTSQLFDKVKPDECIEGHAYYVLHAGSWWHVAANGTGKLGCVMYGDFEIVTHCFEAVDCDVILSLKSDFPVKTPDA